MNRTPHESPRRACAGFGVGRPERNAGPRVVLAAAASLVFGVLADTARGVEVRVGQSPPDVRWVSVTGDTLSWRELGEGRPVVAVFWATWCRVCKRHWPKLTELARRYDDAPGAPRWAAISVGEPPERVARVASERGLPGWILVDPDERGARAMGVENVPTACVIDAAGRVAYFGEAKASRLRRVIDRLVGAPTRAGP